MSTDTIADRRAGISFKTQTSRLVKQLRPYTCPLTDAVKEIHISTAKIDPPFVKEVDMARRYKLLQCPSSCEPAAREERSISGFETNGSTSGILGESMRQGSVEIDQEGVAYGSLLIPLEHGVDGFG